MQRAQCQSKPCFIFLQRFTFIIYIAKIRLFKLCFKVLKLNFFHNAVAYISGCNRFQSAVIGCQQLVIETVKCAVQELICLQKSFWWNEEVLTIKRPTIYGAVDASNISLYLYLLLCWLDKLYSLHLIKA